MMRRLGFALLLSTIAMTAGAQTNPLNERGFKPELVYDFNGFDTVNLSNGNLMASIPLGQSYPVSENFSYSFTLRYTGNLWNENRRPDNTGNPEGIRVFYTPRSGDNAGFGWRISFGELFQGSTQDPNEMLTAAARWRYVTPDGGEHLFWDTLHEPRCSETVTANCDVYQPGISYTRDNSYLRLRDVAGARIIEFPNGQRHRFVATGTGWRLESIYTVTSTFDANGSPTTNYVRFDTTSFAPDWKISDSHGREHWIRRFSSGRVDKVELKAFNGTTATYQLAYAAVTIKEPCRDSENEELNSTLDFLESLDVTEVPGAQRWSFGYNQPTAGCDDLSGVLTSATLPTKGSIGWEYEPFYVLEAPTAVSVKMRTLYDSTGNAIGRKLYSVGPDVSKVSVETQVKFATAPIWRTDFKSVEYRTWNWGPNVGLPFTTATVDSGGRYLSSETFDCDAEANTCPGMADRSTYVRYEMDQQMEIHCPITDPCQSERNRRVVSQKTNFISDNNRFAQTDHSRFDGLGHHRRTVTKAGTVTSSIERQTTTEYNRSAGSYEVDANGNRMPGFNMIATTAPWLLETYDETTETENNATSKRQHSFSPTTGLLLRQRILAGSTHGDTDLLSVFTHDAVGNLVREEYFGGDRQKPYSGSDSVNLSAITPPAHNQYSFRIDHEYDKGVRHRTRYVKDDGSFMPFYVRNDTIDLNTGRVRISRDTAGVMTTYDYDVLGRLTSVIPTGLESTSYDFSNATANTPAKVTVSTGSGDAGTSAIYEFDSVGRLRHEKRLMPDGTWSVRRTTYDTAGRRQTVSEFETFTSDDFTPAAVTTFSGYDVYGRVGSVTAPDNNVTTFTYTGDRLTKRTQKVATSETQETDVSTIEEVDGFGRLIAVTEDAGTSGAATTNYAYDGDRLIGVTMADGAVTQQRFFHYDHRGLLTSEQHPESGTTSYEYDARGHVVKRIGAVATLINDYDDAERLSTVTHQDAGVIKQYVYDRANTTIDKSVGKLDFAERHNRATGAADIIVTEKYFYGGPGGLLNRKETSLSTGEKFAEEYAYDAMGNVDTVTYPTCEEGCPSSSTPNRSVTSAFRHGSPTSVGTYTTAGGVTYHPNGALAGVQHTDASGNHGPLWTQTIANGMARPHSISVTGYCDDLRINVSPQPRTVYAGDAANLTVTATGATSYQWFEGTGDSSIAIAEQTSSTLTAPVTQNTTFWVRVGNGSCTVDSDPALVTVQSCPQISATITAPPEMVSSTTAVASVPAISGATYSWTVTNGAIVSGGTTRTLTFTAACSGTVSLSVTITTNCRTATPSASVAIQPFQSMVTGSTTIAQGSSAEITAALTGVGPWNVTWSDGVVQNGVASSPATRTVNPSGTTTYTVTSVKDAANCSGSRSGSAVITVMPPAPSNVNAIAATATQVNVSWTFSGIKDSFDIYRAGIKIGSSATTSYVDNTASASTAYLYQVKAVKSGTASNLSAPDLAATIVFADDPIVPLVTEPAALHLTQLRDAANAVRAAAGLAPATFTDTITAGTSMRAVHIEELGTSLNQARAALGLPALVFARRPLGGEVISAVDVNELRGGVK